MQRATCRIADGLPLGELARHPEVVASLSNWHDPSRKFNPSEPLEKPAQMVLTTSTRSGKTRLAGAATVRLALTGDVEGLQPGEIPRVPLVSLTLDKAMEAFSQIEATMRDRPALARFLVEEPAGGCIKLRHPSGKIVEIRIAAGKRAGASLISMWLLGAVFDESTRMMGASDGAVVNLDHELAALPSRLRDGGQTWLIGSPWAPMGPVHAKVAAHHGSPSRAIVVIRAKGKWMNPSWWTDKRAEQLRTSKDVADRTSYTTDCEAEYTEAEEGLYPSHEIDAATRVGPLVIPPLPGWTYCAAMDPATRGNAWTLVVKTRDQQGRDIVVLTHQWHAGKAEKLDPEDVLKEIADLLEPYRVRVVATDRWSVDAMTALARHVGLALVEHDYTGTDLVQLYTEVQTKMAAGLLELPPDPDLRADLLPVRKKATMTSVQIVLPLTGSGRHCDYVPSLARVARMHCAQPVYVPETVQDRIEAEALALDLKHYAPKKRRNPFVRDPLSRG